jgi:tetratricopeptide (TPR) repeat protein
VQTSEQPCDSHESDGLAALRAMHSALMASFRDNPADMAQGNLAFETAARLNDADACMDILERQAQVLNDITAWAKAGLFCTQFAKIGRAVHCFEHALAIDPDNQTILLLAASATNAIARHAQSMKYFDRILKGRPPQVLRPRICASMRMPAPGRTSPDGRRNT